MKEVSFQFNSAGSEYHALTWSSVLLAPSKQALRNDIIGKQILAVWMFELIS